MLPNTQLAEYVNISLINGILRLMNDLNQNAKVKLHNQITITILALKN
jgi:hypothetical protein